MTSILDLEHRARHAIETGATITRTVQVRSVAPAPDDEDTREIGGIGVPYGEVIEHLFGRETFDPGSIEGGENARLLWQHRDPIGLVTKGEDTETGYSFTAKVSRTALGDEALTLCRDGVVTGLSIGFEPIEYRIERADDDTETLHWTRVTAREFSLVTFPAYESAQATQRSSTMTDTTVSPDVVTRADLTPLTEGLEDVKREVALARQAGPVTPSAPRWESMGDYIRSLAQGDDDARSFYERAFAGDTTDFDKPVSDIDGTGFLGTYVKFIQARRPFTALFDHGTLPAKGMHVDYAAYTGDTLKVGIQRAQGADLPGPGGLGFVNASAPVITMGGWTEVARQVIERASAEWLNTMWTAFAIRYAKEGEQHVKVAALDIVTKRIAEGGADVLSIADVSDPFAWTDAVIDAGGIYEDNGFTNKGLVLSIDKFKQLSHLKDADGRPMMQIFGSATNGVGQISTANADGTIGTMQVNAIRGVENLGFFYDTAALKVLDNGTPVRLQDQNIINLTQAFSLYGYEAIIKPFPKAIVPLTFAAAK